MQLPLGWRQLLLIGSSHPAVCLGAIHPLRAKALKLDESPQPGVCPLGTNSLHHRRVEVWMKAKVHQERRHARLNFRRVRRVQPVLAGHGAESHPSPWAPSPENSSPKSLRNKHEDIAAPNFKRAGPPDPIFELYSIPPRNISHFRQEGC